MKAWELYGEGLRRAPRWQQNVAVKFRVSADQPWNEGKTVNVSRSGALIESSESPALGCRLEMRLVPDEQYPFEIVAQGTVKRIAQPRGSFGVRIESYRIRPKAAGPRLDQTQKTSAVTT